MRFTDLLVDTTRTTTVGRFDASRTSRTVRRGGGGRFGNNRRERTRKKHSRPASAVAPVVVTRAGRTCFSDGIDALDHDDLVCAREAVHRSQHAAFQAGLPAASRPQLEAEAEGLSRQFLAGREVQIQHLQSRGRDVWPPDLHRPELEEER